MKPHELKEARERVISILGSLVSATEISIHLGMWETARTLCEAAERMSKAAEMIDEVYD